MENRFKKLRVDEQEKRRDLDVKNKLSMEKLSEELVEKCNYYISPSKIKKLESDTPGVKIDDDLLLAYRKFFNVSVDWLLDPSVKTQHIEGNIAVASTETGLSDTSINELKKCDHMQLDIFNRLIESGLISELLDAFLDYAPTIYNSSLNDDYLSYEEYKILKKIENLLKQIFKDTEFCKEVSEHRKERIASRYLEYADTPNESDTKS